MNFQSDLTAAVLLFGNIVLLLGWAILGYWLLRGQVLGRGMLILFILLTANLILMGLEVLLPHLGLARPPDLLVFIGNLRSALMILLFLAILALFLVPK